MDLSADILIITVTKVESRAVIDTFEEFTGQAVVAKSIDNWVYHDLGDVNGKRVIMVQSEMGSGGIGASLQTVQKGINALSPKIVIMVGIAFGIDAGKQSIGDILVSQQLMLYELQRVGTKEDRPKIIPRGDRPHASSGLLNLFRSADLYWDESKANVHFGLILSGEKLVDNIGFQHQLREFEPEAIGGEMEGGGLYVACQDAKVDWILVKSICDWADGNKAQNKDSQQRLAAHNAASFVLHGLQFTSDFSTTPSVETRLQLLVNLRVIELVKVYSSYGLMRYKGGPCPPLEGHINLGMAVENHSQYPAKSIKVDLEVSLLDHTHPECNRTVYTSYDEWYHQEYDRYHWHFRYDGTPDDVCLPEDDLPLGKVEFVFAIPEDSKDFKNMENEDYTQLEETVLKNPITSLIKTGSSNEILQERICRLYQKTPAEDTYHIKYKVRAENFEPMEGEATFTVFWLNDVIPQLVKSDQETNHFDFGAYPDRSATERLRSALLNETPLKSSVDDVLNFLDENNIPRVSAGKKLKYGFIDSLNNHNVIEVILKVRSSRKTQIIDFIFDDSKHLDDIKIQFPF